MYKNVEKMEEIIILDKITRCSHPKVRAIPGKPVFKPLDHGDDQ